MAGLRPKDRCLICLVKVKKNSKYCPSCREKIKAEFKKLVKNAWNQAVQTIYMDAGINPSVLKKLNGHTNNSKSHAMPRRRLKCK
jgi:hypothetical protein